MTNQAVAGADGQGQGDGQGDVRLCDNPYFTANQGTQKLTNMV